MKLKYAAAAILAAFLAAPSARAEDAYPIKLARPVKPGEVYNELYTAVVESREKVAATGGKEENKDATYFKLELNADMTVKEVDKAGDPRVFSLKINSCNDGGVKDFIAAGTVVLVERTETGVSYKVGDAKLPDEAANALNLAFRPAPKTAITDDDEFPCKGPQKIGDRWPVDSAVSARRAAEAGQAIPPANIHGMARFKDIKKDGDTVRLVISTNVDVTLPVREGAPVKEVTMKGDSTYTLPVDPAATGYEQEMIVRYRIVSAPKAGVQEVTVKEITIHHTSTPAK